MSDWILSLALFSRVAVLLFAAYVVYHFLFLTRTDFTIRFRDGRVECEGKVPLTQQPVLMRFLLDDLALKGTVKIQGAWDKKALKLWFRGNLTAGEKQRIRNFLLTQL